MKYSIIRNLYLLLFLLVPLLWSCRKNNDNLPTSPVPIKLTLKQATLVTSGNTFAFDVFGKVNEASPGVNTVISPLSLSYALSMTANGAANATRDSMLKALRVSDITVDDLNNSYKDLTASLLSVDSRVKMEIANSVWAEKTFPVKKSFSDILSNYYLADVRSYDITDATVPQEINTWISDHTSGLIKNMIDRLEDNTVMLLVNAIYFKGKWMVQFDGGKTGPRSFSKPDGTFVDAPTMQQAEKYRVYLGDGFKIAELPYGQGNFVMDIILPDNNSLTPVLNLLDASNFAYWTSSLTERKVNLYLPRFKYGYKGEMKDILKLMGMGIAFSDTADFSNIADWQLAISRVLHQAFIETNEEGTEAAAATIVEIGPTMIGPDDPITFDVNHQFIYIIREVTTNAILFMGKVVNPLDG